MKGCCEAWIEGIKEGSMYDCRYCPTCGTKLEVEEIKLPEESSNVFYNLLKRGEDMSIFKLSVAISNLEEYVNELRNYLKAKEKK